MKKRKCDVMNYKIRGLREILGLTEIQVSSLLNVSNYKYKRIENGDIEIPLDILVLLSILYDLPVDMFVLDKFNFENILNYITIEKMLNMTSKEKLETIYMNMLKHCSVNCNIINYRTIKSIVQNSLKTFSYNLYRFRTNNSIEKHEMADKLLIDIENYMLYEESKLWPNIKEIVYMSKIFNVPICTFFVSTEKSTS